MIRQSTFGEFSKENHEVHVLIRNSNGREQDIRDVRIR